MHPMVLLCDVSQAEAHFGPFETVLISTQDRCMVCADVPYAWKSFWTHPIKLLDDVGKVQARFGLFGDSVNLSAR
jgi:hypothetical protein